MSANNAILVEETTLIPGGKIAYNIFDICVDTYPKHPGYKLNKLPYKNLKRAIKFAQLQYSEYGIRFKWMQKEE
jgi:hypothetical protein